jgi:hypothetical protein
MRTIALLPALLLAGCATMYYGTGARYRKIELVSDPPGAEVAMDGLPVGVAPLTVSIARHDAYVFTFRWADATAECRLVPSFRVHWLLLDMLAGGLLLGPVIDASTRRWSTVDDRVCVGRRGTSLGQRMGHAPRGGGAR